MLLSILIVVLVSLLFSAFFSGMEIAFLSTNKLKLEIEKKHSRAFAFVANLFGRNSGQYITTILVGNNIALVIYSIFMSRLIQRLLGIDPAAAEHSQLFVLVETLISTMVIIFTSEFVPKAVVRTNPNFYYRLFAVPVYLFYLIFYPVCKVVTFMAMLLLRLFGLPVNTRQSIRSFDRTDLEHLLDEANEGHSEHENENEIKLFQNALDFSGVLVRNCMVPRVEIEAIERAESIETLTARFADTRYSRLPVYEGTVDRIVGYVTAKSLLQRPATIDEILMPVDYVPESLPVQKLLNQFIRQNHSLAIVIDEFGGTAGMVTIEDILEEIFGEIEDEHDDRNLVEKQTENGDYIFSGRHEIRYLNEKYRLGIPDSDSFDTLAGYVIERHEGIPPVGEVILADSMKIKVLRGNASRVELLRITLLGE